MARLILTLVVAVGIGTGILSTVDMQPASGQTSTVPPSADVLDEQEVFRLREYLKKTTPSQFVSDSEAARRRLALTKASRARLTGLGPHLISKGGLAGVAAGIWIHNGATLYHGLQGPAAPDPLYLDAEFRQAETALEGSGGYGGGAMRYYENGTLLGSGMVTSASYSYDVGTGKCTVRFDYTGTSSAPSGSTKFVGGFSLKQTGGNSNINNCAFSSLGAVGSSPRTITYNQNTDTPKQIFRFATYDSGGPNAETRRYFGPQITAGEGASWRSPVFDWGSTEMLPAAPGSSLNPYEVPAEDTEKVYNDIVQETCTPEAPPTEVCPDYFPQEWEEEFPPGTEDPYGDPDGDELPNHSDPDDDGDGVPDKEDDQPLVPLPDSPMGDPDEDGDPNKTDPDDDNDGIPDQDDPEPRTPTDPSTLPDDHPYADPDEDGTPNRNDQDDDGDGTPDTEDPAPYDPTQPEPDPNADRDGDDVPDKIDPEPSNPDEPSRYTRTDTDGDGSPDPYDPSPNDPAEPAGGPDGNPDGDGSPNRHDPYPNNPSRPASDPDGDLDQDGTPNRNDPDPYRPAQPNGGPSGDADQDGTPNAQDPAPTDESKPATERGGSCPIAPPRAQIEGPDGAMSAIFPFNMFIMAVENIKVLGAPPKAPPLPILFPEAQAGVEEFSLSEFDPQAALARTIFSVAGSIYCGFFIYKLASQSKEGD